MRITISLAALAAALAGPALAQDAATDYSTVTCADFSAMDEAGMAAAYEGMSAAMAAGGDTSAMTEDTTAEAAATEEMATGEAMGEATADDAMASDDAATDDAATADAATTDMAADDPATADAGSTDMAADTDMDPMMTALAEACAADPSMMAMDAMSAAHGGMGSEMGTETGTETSTGG